MPDSYDLSRRKLLGAAGTIGGAAAIGGSTTMAFFSDEETFANNQLVAGELDLKVDWEEHYSDWKGAETEFAHMEDGELVIDDQDGFMDATLVEAFPDEDNDAMQDELVEPVCSDDSKLADADLPEVLSSDLRTEGTFAGQTTEPGDPLMDLSDVKPGDTGEVTFSLHLCDNPGYIWLNGELVENAENGVNEPEAADDDEDDPLGPDSGDEMSGELADEVMVKAWYDPDCDNIHDDEESVIFASGSLSEVMEDLANGGIRLDPSQYDGNGGGGTGSDGGDGTAEEVCADLGKLEWDGSDFEVDPGSNDQKINDAAGAVGDVFRMTADDGTGRTADIEIIDIEYKDNNQSEPIRIAFDIVDSTDTDSDGTGDIGICQVTVKAANDSQDVYDGPLCITGAQNISTDNFVTGGGTQPAISNIQFDYCLTDDDNGDGGGFGDPDGDCFEPEQTYCVGFEWRLPLDHGNEIQTDSAAFDLGFYTEQCRHNDGSGMNGGNSGS